MSLHHAMRSAAGASPADPYFKDTTLLLLGNGTNGAQNNTFVDDSTNAFSVTRYGNTTQGSFSPFSAPDGRWSNYFDGSGDYLTTPYVSAFNLDSGDWTIECWFYSSSSSGSHGIYAAANSSETSGLVLRVDGNTVQFWTDGYGPSANRVVTQTGTFSLNTWNHVALVRSGSTNTLYVNGTSVATNTRSVSIGSPTNVTVGRSYSNYDGEYFSGNISNLRVLKGTAQYSSAFTPPTTPLTNITNTSLLTCQSNRFLDNSSNAFAITPYGDTAVTPFSPFAPLSAYSASSNGGSGYFDGSGDALTSGTSANLNIFSGDFTIEFFVYAKSFGGYIFSTSKGASPWYGRCAVGMQSTGTIYFYSVADNASGGLIVETSSTISLNAWHHIAVCRSGSTTKIFINGVSGFSGSIGTTPTSDQRIEIGAAYFNNSDYFNGFISSLRVLKGTAQYTAAFTPPTAPLTNITNTSLLLNFTNAGIIDSTAKNDLETVGDVQISTSTKKFGTGSLKFDGTGDYLSIPSSSNLAFGTGDFTIEFWAYLNSQGTFMLYDARTTDPQIVPVIYTYNGRINYYTNGADIITGSTLNASTWYHIAVCRSGTSTKLFVDGTQSGSTYTDSNNYIQTKVAFGVRSYDLTFYFSGYIDDLRITKGVARWTSNFTPATSQLPSR